MTVKLKQDVIYRGRMYRVGDPVPASTDAVAVWSANGLLVQPVADGSEQETPYPGSTAERLTAEGPPGIVEGGTGAEGEMPGRDGRKKKGK